MSKNDWIKSRCTIVLICTCIATNISGIPLFSQVDDSQGFDPCFARNMLAIWGYGAPYVMVEVAFFSKDGHVTSTATAVIPNDLLAAAVKERAASLKSKDTYDTFLVEKMKSGDPIPLEKRFEGRLSQYLLPKGWMPIPFTLKEIDGKVDTTYRCYAVDFPSPPLRGVNPELLAIASLITKRMLVFRSGESGRLMVSECDCNGNYFFELPRR